MGGPSRQCQVCNQAQSKYSCSLACFKRHKGNPCVKSGSSNDAVTTSSQPEFSNDAETPTIKPESSEERSTSSSEVREALKNEHLQKLISDIDSSSDATNELNKAMGADVLRIFSDKIFSAINS